MLSFKAFAAFLPACALVVAVPGPSVLFTIGRALSAGRRSALLTVLGNGVGLAVQGVLVATGLSVLVAAVSGALAALKIAGGLYLVWLGVQAIRSHRIDPGDASAAAVRSPMSDLRTGFVLGLTNPKSLVFLTAFLPQFVSGAHHSTIQMVLLGMTFAGVAIIGDSCWALGAGTARNWFARSPERIAGVQRAGGFVLVGLGVYSVVTGVSSEA